MDSAEGGNGQSGSQNGISTQPPTEAAPPAFKMAPTQQAPAQEQQPSQPASQPPTMTTTPQQVQAPAVAATVQPSAQVQQPPMGRHASLGEEQPHFPGATANGVDHEAAPFSVAAAPPTAVAASTQQPSLAIPSASLAAAGMNIPTPPSMTAAAMPAAPLVPQPPAAAPTATEPPAPQVADTMAPVNQKPAAVAKESSLPPTPKPETAEAMATATAAAEPPKVAEAVAAAATAGTEQGVTMAPTIPPVKPSSATITLPLSQSAGAAAEAAAASGMVAPMAASNSATKLPLTTAPTIAMTKTVAEQSVPTQQANDGKPETMNGNGVKAHATMTNAADPSTAPVAQPPAVAATAAPINGTSKTMSASPPSGTNGTGLSAKMASAAPILAGAAPAMDPTSAASLLSREAQAAAAAAPAGSVPANKITEQQKEQLDEPQPMDVSDQLDAPTKAPMEQPQAHTHGEAEKPPAPKAKAPPQQANQPTSEQQPQPQQHAQQPPPPPPQQQEPPPHPPEQEDQPENRPFEHMRVLRVEDALLYLDEVKCQFSGRPEVYNEFLCIMKNFKSQEVDTPGVIDRVSRLFRGYNNLILGFNKFLPDGYKISMEDLRLREAQQQAEEAEAKARRDRDYQRQRIKEMQEKMIQDQHPGAGSDGRHKAPAGTNGAQLPGQGAVPAQPQSMEVTSGARPHEMSSAALGASNPEVPTPVASTSMAAHAHAPDAAHHPSSMDQLNGTNGAAGLTPMQRAMSEPPLPVLPPAPQQHQAVEFDHAIAYVTTIKRRFSHEPSTYHSFLEILHTYQKEQRGIKEVLEQVAHLFQDHPDLLREFTFFLPDAVQEQAKERLHRAAADSEARQDAQRAQLEQQQQQQQHPSQKHKAMRGRGGELDADPKVIDMTGQYAGAVPTENRNRKRAYEQEAPPASSTSIPISIPQQPEKYEYNCAVERQFFDAAREALTNYTRDGGQAWAEFLKCLDMYAQEILSRNEMLNFVEPLLGKRNTKLFEEFKRILSAAGESAPLVNGNGQIQYPAVTEDSWHSVPLSEIDFSRCRRCTPSYRALPRDYPAPPCSGRTDDDAKVLNDTWVSLPVGSEESYTFRHMRRNTYEETLFRCEDERFEIDMVIDSNACTLMRLEPIAEEISQLAEAELVLEESMTAAKPADTEKGMGGKRFKYAFDKNILGVIHRNSVARIYGDAGQEMLDLMVKNPTVAIPLVVDRLRQKDKEWKTVRKNMNRHWKELAQANYYRSLDHRSLTWRTTDKRAISTRTLIAEIKDRAAHGGKEGKKALQDRMDKAKDEHGTFYEVTMISMLSKNLDLTNLPKPDRRLFTPHLSLMCENDGWAQRDAYRILAFAVERGAMSPEGKERCQRLWTDFLAPWFNLNLGWMMQPPSATASSGGGGNENKEKDAPSVVSNDDDNAGAKEGGGESGTTSSGDVTMAPATVAAVNDDGEQKAKEESTSAINNIAAGADAAVTAIADKELPAESAADASTLSKSESKDDLRLPVGASVSTIYGDGTITTFRQSDQTYGIKLPFGVAYLPPTAMLCSVFETEKSEVTDELRSTDRSKLARADDMLCIGTQNLYLFFRLHQILVRRLCTAKKLAHSVKDNEQLVTLVEQMPGNDGAALGRQRYDAFLSLVYSLLDGGSAIAGGGSAEGGKYEDRVRCLLGHGGYELATMDKLISHILKNLQSMGSDDKMVSLAQLFRRHLDAGSFKPDAFRQEAAHLSEGEDMYAFQKCPIKNEEGQEPKSVLHFEYLGVISDAGDDDASSAAAAPERQAPVPKRQKRER